MASLQVDLQEILSLIIRSEQLALKEYEAAGPDVPGSVLVQEDLRFAALALTQAHAFTAQALRKLGCEVKVGVTS